MRPVNPHATDHELKYSDDTPADLQNSVNRIADRLHAGEITAGQAVDELIEMSIAAEVPRGGTRLRAQVRKMLKDLVRNDPSLARQARRLRGDPE